MDGDGEEGATFVSLFFPLLLCTVLASLPISSHLFSYARRFLGCPVMGMGF